MLIEGTAGAGAGTALGSTFEELRALWDALPDPARARVGFCLDTAHLHAVGYDVAGGIGGVWEAFDRHEWIAEGTIGAEAFRRIMRDPRLAYVIKIIETPKRDDPVKHDRRMLRRLRAYARVSARAAGTI